MVESLLSLESVSRIYGTDVEVHALHQVSLDIFSGDLMSIVGPSGSGKSTMLGLLGLLDLPTNATSMNDFQRSRLRGDAIGFVFQQFHLIPHLSALGNVETALLYRGLSPKKRKKRQPNLWTSWDLEVEKIIYQFNYQVESNRESQLQEP